MLHPVAVSTTLLLMSVASFVYAQEKPARESPRELVKSLGERFRQTSSEHFAIISDADAKSVADLMRTAESTFERVRGLARRLTIEPRKRADPMRVIYFDAWSDYESFARREAFVVQQTAPGFFDERGDRCVIFNFANAEIIRNKREELLLARAQMPPESLKTEPRDAAAQKSREERLRRIRELEGQIDRGMDLIIATVIRHEIAHQVLFDLGLQRDDDHRRRWLKEGLAMQFETISAPNRYRLEDFRAINWSKPPLSIRSLVEDPRIIGPGAEKPQQAYAASWALCYYLIETQPREFAAYLHSPPEREAAGDLRAFEAAFGSLDDLHRRWMDFMAGLK